MSNFVYRCKSVVCDCYKVVIIDKLSHRCMSSSEAYPDSTGTAGYNIKHGSTIVSILETEMRKSVVKIEDYIR